jgi:transcription elongation factor GreA
MIAPVRAAHSEKANLAIIRLRTSNILNQLGAQLMREVSEPEDGAASSDGIAHDRIGRLQAATGTLGLIASGLAVIDSTCIPASGAGYGSTVQVINVDSGRHEEYTLLISSLMDIRANHVSLASPIGQALLGRKAGDQVAIVTPHREVRIKVAYVRTLMQFLDTVETEFLND